MAAVLRRGTRKQHADAERWVPLVGAEVTWEAYRLYLGAMHAYCARLEPALERIPGFDAALPDWRDRKKVPRLARDLDELAAMGHRGLALAESSLDVPRTVAEAFGALYVVEGSTLGGQVIARHLAGTLGVTDRRAGAFLHVYGGDVGPMWKSFRRRLDAFATRRDERASILRVARETFTTITRLLSRGRAT